MLKGEKFKKAFENSDVATYKALLGLLKMRRSIRGFREDSLPREMIEKILEAGRWAPSAGNSQPWEFLVVEDRDTIRKLAELYEYQMIEKRWLEATREKKSQMYRGEAFPGLDEDQVIRELVEDVKGKAPFRNAPCIIFPLADERWSQAFPLRTTLDKGRQHITSSMANAVFAMHLAAAAMHLASQWISDFESPWLSGMTRPLLGIPSPHVIYEAMAVGHPSYYPKPRHVKPLEDLIHYEKYDPAKNRSEEEIREYIITYIRPRLKLKI
jgi:nitroreductase